MALVTVNSVDVISGTVQMPILGVWTADLAINQTDNTGFDAGTAVEISAPDGITLKGVVAPDRTGDFLDTIHVRVLGGAGGLYKTANPTSFTQPGAYVRDVLNALATDSGEVISDTSDQDILNTNLVAWAIFKGPVSSALVNLLRIVAPTATWRILEDGKLWIGVETWPEETDSFELLTHNPTNGTYELGVSSPSIVPGCTLPDIGRVNRVEHQIFSNKIRSVVWTNIQETERGVGASIKSIVKQFTSGIDYFALYDAKLKFQSADLTTVDVTPNDSRLSSICKIPLRHGLPGCKVSVNQGATLRIGWNNGDPSFPFACLWDGDESVNRIQIAGNTDVARKDDTLTASTVLATWAAAVEAGISSGGGTPPPTTFAAAAGLTSGLGKIAVGSSKIGVG